MITVHVPEGVTFNLDKILGVLVTRVTSSPSAPGEFYVSKSHIYYHSDRVDVGDPNHNIVLLKGAVIHGETVDVTQKRYDFVIDNTSDASGKVFAGTPKDDVLKGTRADDFLYGYVGNDVLRGETGRDTLDGGAGKDTIIGGGGNDVLVGGPDVDTFVFSKTSGRDVIEDFERTDHIEYNGNTVSWAQLAQNAIHQADGSLVDFDGVHGGATVFLKGVHLPIAAAEGHF